MEQQAQIPIDLCDGSDVSRVEERLHQGAMRLFTQRVHGDGQAQCTDGGGGISRREGLLGQELQQFEVALFPCPALDQRPLLGSIFQQGAMVESERRLRKRRFGRAFGPFSTSVMLLFEL